jgi:hypothetical protein
MCSDIGYMKGLAVLHCMEQTLVYNCLACHHGSGGDGYVTTEVFPLIHDRNRILAVAAGVSWEFSKAKPGHAVFESVLVPWITATFSMTLATNVLCTGI